MSDAGSDAGSCGGSGSSGGDSSPVDCGGVGGSAVPDLGPDRLIDGTSPAARRAADRLRSMPPVEGRQKPEPPQPWTPEDMAELESNVRSHYRMVRLMAAVRWLAIILLAAAACMAVWGLIQ